MSSIKNSTYYTNCRIGGNCLQYRGIENGKRIIKRIPYLPTLFVPTNKESKFKTLFNQPVEPIKFEDIKSAKKFLEKYRDIENFKIYGNSYYNYCYLLEKFPGKIDYSLNDIKIANIDIETDNDLDAQSAKSAIISITVKIVNDIHVFGYGEYKEHLNNVVFHKFNDEITMLKKFITFWSSDYPDIITGWNINGYDIPYLYNRLMRLFGEDFAKKLSPWEWISKRTVIIMDREIETIALPGISSLDYLELYKKHAPEKNRESYKLDYIGHVEVGERKLDYGEYGSLKKLHNQNYQKFIEYNIQDVLLVEKINKKLKLIELVISMAYRAKVNYEDLLGQVRVWDTLIFAELIKNHIVVPQQKEIVKKTSFTGALVKSPISGKHRWVASLDVNSLYPSIIQMFNISPESILEDIKPITIDDLFNETCDTADLKEKNFTLAANGCIFKYDQIGILPTIIKKMFDERKEYKKKKIEAEEELEKVKKELSKRGIKYNEA